MPIDVSPGSLAAVAITTLFWWTVLSPVALLAVAVLCGTRPRLRAALTIAVLAPPVVTLLPVAVMHGGPGAIAAVGGRARGRRRHRPRGDRASPARSVPAPARERYATASFLFGVAGGMIGSAALVGALLFA